MEREGPVSGNPVSRAERQDHGVAYEKSCLLKEGAPRKQRPLPTLPTLPVRKGGDLHEMVRHPAQG